MRKDLQNSSKKTLDHTISKLILEQEITSNKIEQLMLAEISIRPTYQRTDTQKFVDACKNITTYCKELRSGMDQQDTEAIKRLFDKHGDRSNKNKARLRYVLKRVDEEEFVQ